MLARSPDVPRRSTIVLPHLVVMGVSIYIDIDDELLDLNKSVANVGTQPGCPEKIDHCLASPCWNGSKYLY